MTIRKYLTTPEEILALKDTDTKIYDEDYEKDYHQFINGVLCSYTSTGSVYCNSALELSRNNYYILAEEPVKEADEKDIGKLCCFWNDEGDKKVISTLRGVHKENLYPFFYWDGHYKHCRRLTPAEVAEITGYKVEE